MNAITAFALARLLAALAATVAALGAVAQDEEERARPSSRSRRLGMPGAQAPGVVSPGLPGSAPQAGASLPGAVPVPGAASAPAPGAPFAVPGPVPAPAPPTAQPPVSPADTTASPAVPAVVPPPRPLAQPAPVDPARSDAPGGWPKVVVGGGTYSPNRAHRVVIINGAPVREGAEPVPGVVVQQVRADRVVLSYRGQRHTVMY